MNRELDLSKLDENQEIRKRVEFARVVIESWRVRTKYYDKNKMQRAIFELQPVTYGMIGILDYILKDNYLLIKDPTLRRLFKEHSPKEST